MGNALLQNALIGSINVDAALHLQGKWAFGDFEISVQAVSPFHLAELPNLTALASGTERVSDAMLKRAFVRGVHEQTMSGKTMLDIETLSTQGNFTNKLKFLWIFIFAFIGVMCCPCGSCCCI